MSTRLGIQKGQLRAILAGAVHTCARMWERGTVVTGLCPACGHENEDLTHLWWNCEAEKYAHIREKAPQPTNVEAMHPAYRDMILAQKDTQLLDWERNSRTNEIVAVAAAHARRCTRVETMEARRPLPRRQKNLEGTSVKADCRYGRTGRALTRDGKRLRDREQESYFSKDSKLNIHFSIKARTGQT